MSCTSGLQQASEQQLDQHQSPLQCVHTHCACTTLTMMTGGGVIETLLMDHKGREPGGEAMGTVFEAVTGEGRREEVHS